MLFRPLLLATAFVASVKAQGSYWVVYPGDAFDGCQLLPGQKSDARCCSKMAPGFPIMVDATCFVNEGLLGDGSILQFYLGCDGGVPKYGEACYNNGENGGLIPTDQVVENFNATDIQDCGCIFQISGNGCYKIRDFSSLPGFEDDTRQVFINIDETCEALSPAPTPVSTSAATAASTPTSTEDPSSSASKTMLVFPIFVTAAMLHILVYRIGVDELRW